MQLETQAQDGMRVRASAGAASFRREPTLEKALQQAQAQVEQLGEASGAGRTAVQRAAQERAARERVERLEAALEAMPAAKAAKKTADRDKARVSSTEPGVRIMKMPDGGFQPAYNWQFSTAARPGTDPAPPGRVVPGCARPRNTPLIRRNPCVARRVSKTA